MHFYFYLQWPVHGIPHLQVLPGLAKFQTFWEFMALFISLVLWGDWFVAETVTLFGDNVAALSDAINLSGKGNMLALARELTCMQARRGWNFNVAHIPGTENRIADALSRVYATDPIPLPECLSSATLSQAPALDSLWKLRSFD